jgi:hypothetical protein
VELSELVRDRDVALRVAETDRRRDVERPFAARLAAYPTGHRLRRRDEVPEQQVHFHRVAGLRQVARALERDELATRRFGERDALRMRPNRVLVAVHDEHRAAHARAQLGELDPGRQLDPVHVVGDRLGRRFERPADAVLDLLRRMRFREALPEEVLEEGAVVAQPVVVVVLGPALIRLKRFVERIDGALGERRCERDRRPDEGRAGHALRVLRGEHHSP